MFATAFLMSSNTTVYSGPYSIFLTGSFIFFNFLFSRSRGLSLSVRVAAFGINFERWFMLPKKDPSSFNERGCSNLSMAAIFVIFGVFLFSNSLCPYQIISVLMNSHFDSLGDKFCFFKLH